ncbi:MAG TPA: glycosyltransferase [Pyrinomonadaceae bacterium]
MKISVVIPVRNEEESLPILLDGLMGQTRQPEEIVITDGGSTDRTPRVIEEYIERGAPIHLVRTSMAMPGRGRNLAAERATSEWLAFTDGGMRVAGNWLEGMAERAEREGVDVVYGGMDPVVDTFFKECAAIAYVKPPKESSGTQVRPQFIASALMRRSVWQAVGGFPEHLRSAEDLLFMNKVSEAKFRTVFAPDAKVFWNLQPTFWRTFKRFYIYSRHNIRAGLAQQWHANIFTQYAMILISGLPALAFGWRWWVAATIALWLLALTARSILSIRRNRSCLPAGALRNAARTAMIVAILAVIDLATFLGTISWLVKDKFNWVRTSAGATHDA